jgi:putative ABC transport system permease protein
MTTWTWTVREWQRRPARTLLTLSGIAIGVAILIASLTAIAAARVAYRDLFDSTNGKETLEVVAPGAAGFDGGVAVCLETVPGVEAVCPRVLATAALVGPAGAMPAVVVGIEAGHPALSPCAGRSFDRGAGAWLDARTALAHGWQPGTTIRFWTPSGLAEMPLAGTVTPAGPAAQSGTALLYLPLATAQRLFAFPGQVNSLDVLLQDGADAAATGQALSARLPPGLILQSSNRRGDTSRSTLRVVEHGLTALCLIALVAAGFVVLNTVLLNITERRGQFALLRALGATSRQVRRLLLREAALLGGLGALLGTGVGLALAQVLHGVVGGFLSIELARPHPALGTIVIALAAGTFLSLLATWAGIWWASRQPPLQDLLGPRGRCRGERAGRCCFAGAALLVVAACLDASLCLGWWPGAVAGQLLAPGVAALLAGCALALPLLLPLFLGVCARLLRCFWRFETCLATCQLLRRPARTGLSAGVLFLGIASAVGFGHYLANSFHDMKEWGDRAIVEDYLVRGTVPDSCFLLATPLPETLAEELEAVAAVDHVDKIAFLPATVNGHSALLLARTFSADRPPAVDLREGDPALVWQGLLHGEVVMGVALARRLNVRAGDSVTLQTRRGRVALRVAGTVTEYVGGGDALYLEWQTAKDLVQVPGVHAFLVSARPGSIAALTPALGEYCSGHGLVLQSNADLRGHIDGLLARIKGGLWVLVGLIFAVGSLGVVNTLTMNVLEQAHELSVLRAIGMTSGQVRRIVVCQALLTGLASLAPGAAAGVALAALITRMANVAFGQQTPFAVDWTLTCGCFAAAMAIAGLAALLPARHAARLSALYSGV